jgi:hypothetical protein
MAGRKYPVLDIETFGKHLLESGDLDPIYIALNKMELQSNQLSRWLMAYWCLYHAGTACYMSRLAGDAFWDELHKAAANVELTPTGTRWPRGHERRHFRGAAATTAVAKLRALGDPADIVADIIADQDKDTFANVAGRAQKLPLFGPWISFKICDMLDRLELCAVDFDEAAVFMFTDPTKAALKLWRLKTGLPEEAKPRDQAKVIHEVVAYLTDHFKDHSAPPLHDRPVGLQEVETILCKWKSHGNGHYPLNNDIDEIMAGLEPWGKVTDVAELMSACMPKRLVA